MTSGYYLCFISNSVHKVEVIKGSKNLSKLFCFLKVYNVLSVNSLLTSYHGNSQWFFPALGINQGEKKKRTVISFLKLYNNHVNLIWLQLILALKVKYKTNSAVKFATRLLMVFYFVNTKRTVASMPAVSVLNASFIPDRSFNNRL